MEVTIYKPTVPNIVRAVSSKSFAHRALICAALSQKETQIVCKDTNQDIEATVRVLNAMGADISRQSDRFTVRPIKERKTEKLQLDCGESGSTLRFLLPVASALGLSALFTGHGRLLSRPMTELINCLTSHGANICTNEQGIELSGKLKSGRFEISGGISSQFITGLLLALPLLEDAGEIKLTSRLQSAPYVDITQDIQRKFGIFSSFEKDIRRVPSDSYISPAVYNVEGDWSNAAFFLACGALGKHEVTVTGLDSHSIQGDRRIADILSRFGAELEWNKDELTVSPRPLRALNIDAQDIPDLVPVIAVCAAAAKGKTVISGISRLRLKESDRAASVTALIRSLGGDAEADEDTLTVYGTGKLKGGSADGAGDHRIVMSAAAAALICENEVHIKNAEAVEKSYPSFFDVYFEK